MGRRTVIQCDLATCATQVDIHADASQFALPTAPGWVMVYELESEPSHEGARLTFCSWEHLTLYGVSKKAEA